MKGLCIISLRKLSKAKQKSIVSDNVFFKMKCQAYMYFNHHDGHVYVCMYMTPIHTAQSSEYIGYVNNIWIENKLKPL